MNEDSPGGSPILAGDRSRRVATSRFESVPAWLLDVTAGLLVVVAFIVLITEPLPVDPMMYLEESQDLGRAELNVGTARLLLLIPASIASWLFGYSEAALYLVPLGFAFIFGAATSALGRHIFNPTVGMMAALVAASGPIILPYGTQLLPDIGAAALVTASLFFVYRASEKSPQTGHRDSLLAGLLFGSAYLVRETSLIFTPAFLAAAWLLKIRDRRLVSLALGALVAPILEIPAGWILWDDPFFRLDALTGRGAPLSEETQRGQISFAAQTNFFTSLKIFVDLMWRSLYGKVVLLGSALFGAVAVIARKRRYVALAIWILVAWGGFAAVGAIKPSGRIMIRLLLERYWAFLMPVLAIAVLGGLAFLMERADTGSLRLHRFLLIVAAVGGLFLGGLATFDARGDWFMRFGHDGYWELRSSLPTLPEGARLQVEGSYVDLTRLYTADTFGTPITDIEIVDPSLSDPQWLLVSNSDLTSDASSTDGVRDPLSDSYVVFAAETTHPEWVLLTSREELGVPVEAILEIGDSVEWLGRTVKDNRWSDPFSVAETGVSLAADEELIIFDSSASYGRPSSASAVRRGALVELHSQFRSISGQVSVICQFHDATDQEERLDVRALSVLQGGDGGGRLTAFCRAPETDGRWSVRPVLVVSGPGHIALGHGQLVTPGA